MYSNINSLRRWAKNRPTLHFLYHVLLRFLTSLDFIKHGIIKGVQEFISITFFKHFTYQKEDSETLPRCIVVLISKTDNKSPHTEGWDYLHFYKPFLLFAHNCAPDVEVLPWYLDAKNSIRTSYNFLMFLKQNRPGSLILSSWNMSDPRLSSPSAHLLHVIRNRLQLTKKVIVLGWDTVDDGFWERHLNFSFVEEIIALDNPIYSGKHLESHNTKHIRVESHLPVPINLSLLRESSISARNFGVTFFGQIGSYRDYRLPYISLLNHLDHQDYISAAQDKFSQPSFQQMYEILSQSKIGVNFSGSVKGRVQLKARVWETLLSGALLLEQENLQILEYFTPNVHFVFFDSPESLAQKVDYYLAHESERAKIATAGRERAHFLQSEQGLFKRLIADSSAKYSPEP